MQEKHSYKYTGNITVYLRIQYGLWDILYTGRKVRKTRFQWDPTQGFRMNSTKDIVVLVLGLVW